MAEFASKGVAGAGLGTGIAGLSLGVLNSGLFNGLLVTAAAAKTIGSIATRQASLPALQSWKQR